MSAHPPRRDFTIPFSYRLHDSLVFFTRFQQAVAVSKLSTAETVKPASDTECLFREEVIVSAAIYAFVKVAIELIVSIKVSCTYEPD